MTCYSVLAVTAHKQDWVPNYVQAANALVAKHGGKYLARTSSHSQIEGEGPEVGLRIVIEWPSKQATLEFMSDPEYLPYLHARLAGADSQHHLIEGVDDLA